MFRSINKTLILRLSSIGDVILTTPMLRAMKQTHPGAEIHFVVRKEYASLLRHHPGISRVHELELSHPSALSTLRQSLVKEKFDSVFDLQNNFRTRYLRRGLARTIRVVNKRSLRRLLLVKLKQNTFQEMVPVPERYMEAASEFGLKPDNGGPEIFLPESTQADALNMLRERGWGGGSAIGFCPGAKHFTKRWPAEHFCTLRDLLLSEMPQCILIFGGTEDRGAAEQISKGHEDRVLNLCGKIDLLHTAAAMDECSVIVTNDSGLMHMATARKIPVIALFGSTVKEFGFFPYNAKSTVLEVEGLSCRPCTHIGRSSCPKGHFRCMNDITPDEVSRAISPFFQ